MKNNTSYILPFTETDKTKFPLVGGKGANLGELSRIAGVQVPEGFCITTEAYKEITGKSEAFHSLLDQLVGLKADDRKAISEVSNKIRKTIEAIPIPDSILQELSLHLEQTGQENAYAVRSSATAEDLPTLSFAGQQDTYLNVIGKEAILKHISKCWASLFTDRAVTYRMQNGFDHRQVCLSVIIQKMIFPLASGILFTADPVSSNRKVLSIDAGFGLGEALVSGLVSADNYKVKDGNISGKIIATKKAAIYELKEGGTASRELNSDQQKQQVLTDAQILQLAQLGRKIEMHFGYPQDIEWCSTDDAFYIVQSRPITTLYPIPKANDQENRVYISVGHQQMMTDAMKPLGLSFYLIMAQGLTTAGGRLFADVTPRLASPSSRENLLNMMGHSDPLLKDAMMTLLERGDFIKTIADDGKDISLIKGHTGMSAADIQALAGNDPAIASDLIKRSQDSLASLKDHIGSKSGIELLDFILESVQQLKQLISDPKNLGVIMAAMNAAAWLNDKMKEWLDEKNVADVLSQSLPDNVTSEMGLALLDIADLTRPYPEMINYLQQAGDGNFLEHLKSFDGGEQVSDAIYNFLSKYGMRCAGEIDITKTRWSEKPAMIIPMILGNIKNLDTGAGKQKFEQGLQEALKKEQELLARLNTLPDGEQKAAETKQMIFLVRNLAGYREYPKYNIVSHYYEYKKALLGEAERLVRSGLIKEKEDIYYLSFDELREVVRSQKTDYQLVLQRKEEYRNFEKLTPPRLITSDGEIITGRYKREDLPEGSLVGLPVSSGIIEGRARVISDIEHADLEAGDILVTSFTDPSWTPLFISIKGLVTEVGGLMTHGSVIAREYGLPAVVGVENATKLIKDGQKIRVNGTEGYIEILS